MSESDQRLLERRGIQVDLLVKNAGFGLNGEFLSHNPKQEQDEIEVNVLFRDCLRTAGISQINAENGTPNLVFRIEARGQGVQFVCGAGHQYQVHPTLCKASANAAPRPFEAPVTSLLNHCNQTSADSLCN